MSRLNVVLLIFDSLRADYVGTYGGGTETAAFDRLAAEGTLFENAYTAAPGTTPSHSSLFSGRYPSDTGMFMNMDNNMPSDVPLLASWLRDADYDTVGLTGASGMGSQVGLDRGFDYYFEPYYEMGKYVSLDYLKKMWSAREHLVPFAKEFLNTAIYGSDGYTGLKFDSLREYISRRLEQPFFAMVNFVSTHRPYDPPRPYRREMTPELDRPRWYALEKLFGGDERLDRDDVRDERVFRTQKGDGMAKYMGDDEYLTEAELDVVKDWYRGSIHYIDDQLMSFLDWMDRHGVLDETIVIATSDHGEMLGEHGLMLHNHYLFDEVTRIPLVIRAPGVGSGVRRDDFVSLIDVFDTVCDLVGIDAPDGTSGRSMFSGKSQDFVRAEHGWSNPVRQGKRKYMSEHDIEDMALGRKCVRTDSHLYVLTSEGDELLYERELGRSPVETLLDDPPDSLLSEHRETLEAEMALTFGSGEVVDDLDALDEEIRQNLEDLGYVD